MIKTLLLCVCLCLTYMSQAQLSQNLSKRFPAHIVYEVENVVSKINLTEAKQIQIAEKLLEKDRLANTSLINGEAVSKLKSYYTIDANFLKPILSAEEIDDYKYLIDKDNRFLVALKFATQLKLSKTQISEIRNQNDSLGNVAPMTAKKTFGFYNTKLSKILSKEQYVFLLQTIYKKQSIEDAQKDWIKIKQLKLLDEKNEKTEFTKIFNYHVIKNSILDEKAEKYDNNKIEEITKNLVLKEPPVLIRANIFTNGIYKNNRYTTVLKFEKELGLTKIQIDSLLSKYIQIERARFENKVRKSTATSPTEYENIVHILTKEQVEKWLAFKNREFSNNDAKALWEKLKKEGLANNLEMNATVKVLAAYQLEYLIAREREIIYNTHEAALMKWNVEKKRPELLKQLDFINQTKSKNTAVKNALTW
ncbi:hypothetical protein EOD40_16245 [Flavobacterium sufflavum]|uniref:Peptidylprolyl isomerase n=1 Tax=Flavobacterium sufflavum TaxID=1921138 RepID=A0A437KLF9_9FLAO|nr:hypothetical protein [Flavobacterium sufflavum]RVT71970.1 hypothetical protein EOD40_16245 [Flavobacterium sufflavum]